MAANADLVPGSTWANGEMGSEFRCALAPVLRLDEMRGLKLNGDASAPERRIGSFGIH